MQSCGCTRRSPVAVAPWTGTDRPCTRTGLHESPREQTKHQLNQRTRTELRLSGTVTKCVSVGCDAPSRKAAKVAISSDSACAKNLMQKQRAGSVNGQTKVQRAANNSFGATSKQTLQNEAQRVKQPPRTGCSCARRPASPCAAAAGSASRPGRPARCSAPPPQCRLNEQRQKHA